MQRAVEEGEADRPGVPPSSARGKPRRKVPVRIVVFLGAGALVIAVAAAGFRPIWNNDIGFHIRLGATTWEQGSLPDPDHHSFTADGAKYLDHEWLPQVLFFAVDRAAGVRGLVALKGLLLLAALGLVAWASRGNSAAMLTSVAMCAFVVFPRIQLRPHMIAWVLLGALLLFQRRRSIVGVAAVLAVWANCHASFILGVAMSVLLLAEWHPKLRGRRVVIDALAVLASPCLNPFGPAIYGYGLIIRNDVWFVDEWQPFEASSPYLWVFLAMAAFVAIDAATRREGRWLDLARVVLLATLALAAMRHTAEAALFLCPVLAGRLGRWWERAPRALGMAVCGALAALAVGVTGWLIASRAAFRFGIDRFALPVAATDFVLRHRLEGRMFNDYNFGGYLLWKAWPLHPVFVDGRLEVYGPTGVLDDYLRASAGGAGAASVLDKHRVDFAVIRADRPLARRLASDANWGLVYFDYNSAVFVRAGTSLDVRRLRLLTPWGNRGRGELAASIDEARYLIAQNPWFFGGYKILSFLLYRAGDYPGAARNLERYLTIWPAGADNPETMEMMRALRRREARGENRSGRRVP
jgi:hypothetical protein